MNLKSFLSIPLAICLLCSSTFTAAATSDITNPETEAEIRAYLESSPSATTTNEYDILKEQQDSAHAVLDSRTASEQEVEDAKEILSFDPVEHFYDLQDKGKAYLEEQGYPVDQIEAIMEFDGSEDAIYRASASVTADLLILDRGISGSRRYFEAKYIFSWDKVPSFCWTDLISITSDNYYHVRGSGSSKVYYSSTASSNNKTETLTVDDMPNCYFHGAGVDIPMTKNYSGTIYHALTGHMTVQFDNENGDIQTGVLGTYVHSTIVHDYSLSASLGFPGDASAGLNLELRKGMSEMNETSEIVKIK